MKKAIAVFCAACLACLLMTACSFALAPPMDRILEDALSALENNDQQAFHTLFLPGALEETDTTPEAYFQQINDVYQGTLQDYQQQSIVQQNHITSPVYNLTVACTYEVTTSVSTYIISLKYHDLKDGNTGLAGFFVTLQS